MSLFRPKIPIKVMHRNRNKRSHIKRGGDLTIGEYGLKMLTPCEINEYQLEACRKAMQGKVKRMGKIVCRPFPNRAKGSKPVESRMGKGAATPDHWYYFAPKGVIIWEITGVNRELAISALKLAQVRLPGVSKIVCAKNQYTT
ncbi:MAG: 50S ribosomal protein L16 [Pseudomonadota bacterium]